MEMSFSHVFEAHLLAAVTNYLSLETPDDQLPELPVKDILWLRNTAQEIVKITICPEEPPLDLVQSDQLYLVHRQILYYGYLYRYVREAVRNEDGVKIVRSWKHWMIAFVGAGRRNYATEAANFLANLKADWPNGSPMWQLTTERSIEVE
eukprot:m.34575 g.34575  ORF g.34575 m.34575 type:complete len:150 (+) comp31999_c0_seq2:1430-1879(+)